MRETKKITVTIIRAIMRTNKDNQTAVLNPKNLEKMKKSMMDFLRVQNRISSFINMTRVHSMIMTASSCIRVSLARS